MASTAVSSHINALQAKHADLETRLHQELARPVPDTATIQALKKQKLRLKEEIAACWAARIVHLTPLTGGVLQSGLLHLSCGMNRPAR